jgi:hypothetical protein
MNGVLGTALAFARHRHSVFPVNWPVDHGGKLICSCGGDSRGRPCGKNAAKHPYGKLAPRSLLSATTDTGIIKAWFGMQALSANLGVTTDRLVVVDIDPRHGGDESFDALIRDHGDVPPTWRALTGGGGEHVMFAPPDGVEIKNVVAELMDNPPLGRGVDVRARGGYIIAPPSRHMSGRKYEWSVDGHPQDVELAPAPGWLIEKLTASGTAGLGARSPEGGTVQHEPTSSDEWVKLTQQPVSEYREFIAGRITYHLFRHNCDFQLVRGLMQAWNSAWCKPPLGFHELDRIIGRIAIERAKAIEKELD